MFHPESLFILSDEEKKSAAIIHAKSAKNVKN
jgi:hypothetical protein